VYISPYCRQVLVPPNFMKFGIRGQLTDIITWVKVVVDRFNGYGVLTTPKLPFPIDLLRRRYNSVRTTVRHCDSNYTKYLPQLCCRFFCVLVNFRRKFANLVAPPTDGTVTPLRDCLATQQRELTRKNQTVRFNVVLLMRC